MYFFVVLRIVLEIGFLVGVVHSFVFLIYMFRVNCVSLRYHTPLSLCFHCVLIVVDSVDDSVFTLVCMSFRVCVCVCVCVFPGIFYILVVRIFVKAFPCFHPPFIFPKYISFPVLNDG